MAFTIEELKDKLKQFDEVHLLEILNISSEDLVDRFEDVIISRRGYLLGELEELVEEEWRD